MPDATMHCHLCGEVTSIGAIVNHVRLMHPDVYEGKPVVDTTAFREPPADPRQWARWYMNDWLRTGRAPWRNE